MIKHWAVCFSTTPRCNSKPPAFLPSVFLRVQLLELYIKTGNMISPDNKDFYCQRDASELAHDLSYSDISLFLGYKPRTLEPRRISAPLLQLFSLSLCCLLTKIGFFQHRATDLTFVKSSSTFSDSFSFSSCPAIHGASSAHS